MNYDKDKHDLISEEREFHILIIMEKNEVASVWFQLKTHGLLGLYSCDDNYREDDDL